MECVFIIPQKPMPFGKNHYIKTLEERVAELEGFLLKEGLLHQVKDYRQYLIQPATSVISDEGTAPINIEGSNNKRHERRNTGVSSVSSENDDLYEWQKGVDSMVGVLRDLSLDANGGYIGASSHITMGKLVGSIVKGRERSKTPTEDSNSHIDPVLRHEDQEEYGDFEFSDVPADVADRLIIGYMKVSAFPILPLICLSQ